MVFKILQSFIITVFTKLIAIKVFVTIAFATSLHHESLRGSFHILGLRDNPNNLCHCPMSAYCLIQY